MECAANTPIDASPIQLSHLMLVYVHSCLLVAMCPQILSGRTEKRQLGTKTGTSYSVASYVNKEEVEGDVDHSVNAQGKKWEEGTDGDFWREALSEEMADLAIKVRRPIVQGIVVLPVRFDRHIYALC